MAVEFTHPLLLSAFVLLPVLWFLLRAVPQRPRQVSFPGLFFLRTIKDKRETPHRTPWYILLIRLLGLAALIIAFAGPILNAPKAPPVSTKASLLLVDNGWPAADDWDKRQDTVRMIAQQYTNDHQYYLALTAADRKAEIIGPLLAEQLIQQIEALRAAPLAPDRHQWQEPIQQLSSRLGSTFDIHWLSDNLLLTQEIQERRFAAFLHQIAPVTAYRDEVPAQIMITSVSFDLDDIKIELTRAARNAPTVEGQLNLYTRNGRAIAQTPFTILAGEKTATATTKLPLAMRNEVGRVKIAGQNAAGANWLIDARHHQSLIGLFGQSGQTSGTLLDGKFYIRQALAPYALFREGTIEDLINNGAGILIFDDIGRFRESQISLLDQWVAQGGVVVRFAGPTLADSVASGTMAPENSLLPVVLRGTGRAFGGALTWETPQPVGGIAEMSPFNGLTIDPEIKIRRQILASPIAETSERSWVWLADGTPLVTAKQVGKGYIILFHIAATPDWSDLPISGMFVEMLRRIATLSTLEHRQDGTDMPLQPLRFLTGDGQLIAPQDDSAAVTFSTDDHRASATALPGIYGNPDAPRTINVMSNDMTPWPLSDIGAFDGGEVTAYTTAPPLSLTPLFLLIALVFFLIDSLIAIWLHGRNMMKWNQMASLTAFIFCAIVMEWSILASPVQAQSDLDPKAIEGALQTRLSYVITGDQEVDRLSEAGLAHLSRLLHQRTALEPAAPVGIDLERDIISVYPVLYWPILATTTPPSDQALYRLETYMDDGGLIIFDTRDGDRLIGNGQTPEQSALRRILVLLNIPPLEPLPEGHVLGRSFYLLDDLPGRNENGPVWVAAAQAMGHRNDNVTPLIIGGRDWAAAWATDANGRPLRPMGAGGFRRRDYAIRAGINIVMVALTGNYKVDQLQVDSLLDRLDQEPSSKGRK